MDKIKHPCIGVCNGWMREDTICTGCGRSLVQVRDWLGYSEEQKRQVLNEIQQRQQPSLE